MFLLQEHTFDHNGQILTQTTSDCFKSGAGVKHHHLIFAFLQVPASRIYLCLSQPSLQLLLPLASTTITTIGSTPCALMMLDSILHRLQDGQQANEQHLC